MPASAVLSAASKLSEWISKQLAVNDFSEKLVGCLKGCTLHFPTRAKERKCGGNFTLYAYQNHSYTFGRTFLGWPVWILDINSMLYQRISDIVFEELITRQFSVEQVKQPTVAALTYEETNALRYVAGYVCHKLKKKIETSKHPSKGDLLLCLMELCDEDDETSSSADWTHIIDRGGLCRVSENTYMVFYHMKMLVRKSFNATAVQEVTSELRERVKHGYGR